MPADSSLFEKVLTRASHYTRFRKSCGHQRSSSDIRCCGSELVSCRSPIYNARAHYFITLFGNLSSVMHKSNAIARIARSTRPSEVTADSIHFANVNASKHVWWLDIPLAKVESDGSPNIALLLYDHRPDQLHYLEVPKIYLRDNQSRLVVRQAKACISLELSTETHNLFRDVRPTGGGVNFAQFLKYTV